MQFFFGCNQFFFCFIPFIVSEIMAITWAKYFCKNPWCFRPGNKSVVVTETENRIICKIHDIPNIHKTENVQDPTNFLIFWGKVSCKAEKGECKMVQQNLDWMTDC